MSLNPASTSHWVAADYARVGAFVPELGRAALDLLDPRPGQRIPDVPEGERADLAAAVADRAGSTTADYVRLRFIMRKPA